MNLQDFKKAGHWPTLLGGLSLFRHQLHGLGLARPADDLHHQRTCNFPSRTNSRLSRFRFSAGAFFRVPLGLLADAIGPKMTGILAQVIVMFAVLRCLFFGLTVQPRSRFSVASLGVAGASFAVALPQAGRWYPPQYQGVVMGIAGAGNMGVVLDTLFAPSIAETFGWQAVYGVLARAHDRRCWRSMSSPPRTRPALATVDSIGATTANCCGLRQPLVHVLLLHHLRRLRRSCRCASALFHHAVSRDGRRRGPHGRADRRLSARVSGRSAAISPTASAASRRCRSSS